MTPGPHAGEYHDSMVAFLEWIWGRDFMAPGGEGNVEKLVTGIDLEPQLIQRATRPLPTASA